MLKIQNFGPIKGGYTQHDGYLPFSKVTILCGTQGVGKSCVAKVFSTFSWLEKALVRGDFDVEFLTRYNRFRKMYCSFQNIQNYFQEDTFLHYIGSAFSLKYENGRFEAEPVETGSYEKPQIMYVPAERNLLSVIDNAENVKGLPQALASLLEVYDVACKNLSSDVSLPVSGHVRFHYDKLNKISSIRGEGYSVKLSEASSGFQSLSPLYIVLEYLSRTLNNNLRNALSTNSLKEQEVIERRIKEILRDDKLDVHTRRVLAQQATDTRNKCLLSIVEEPEQNLYPASQFGVTNDLLAFHRSDNSQLVLTTHSPYIINYVSLAIKAEDVARRTQDEKMRAKISEIVPEAAWTSGEHVAVFELMPDGCIVPLSTYDGMPSDENLLNTLLGEMNEKFNSLLEIEDVCQQ